MLRQFRMMVVLGVILLTGTVLHAEAPAQPPAMAPEQQAMMERMKEFTTLNENHAFLKTLVGSWKTKVKFWMDPQGQPEESIGHSQARMILDEHFLEQIYVGTVMGKPFEGRGVYGYDNLRKEYTGIWLDNMSTGVMLSAGQYDATAKTLKDEGSMSCPITNETHRWYRSATTIVDENHYTYETFMKDKDGKEFRSMLIEYTRS